LQVIPGELPHVAVSKRVAAKEIERQCAVTYKTAYRIVSLKIERRPVLPDVVGEDQVLPRERRHHLVDVVPVVHPFALPQLREVERQAIGVTLVDDLRSLDS
jgi:hypothetical protein